MNEKIKLVNNLLLSILIVISIIFVFQLVIWLPKIGQSEIKMNSAKCLESYSNQGQPPLGACGFDF